MILFVAFERDLYHCHPLQYLSTKIATLDCGQVSPLCSTVVIVKVCEGDYNIIQEVIQSNEKRYKTWRASIDEEK